MLDAVEAEPPQLPGTVDADRPGAGPVVGEIGRFGGVISDQMVGHAVAVEVGHRVVKQAVAVEVQADRVQLPVAVHIGIGRRGPHGGRTVVGA